MSSCCTLRLKRRNALSIDSLSCTLTSAKLPATSFCAECDACRHPATAAGALSEYARLVSRHSSSMCLGGASGRTASRCGHTRPSAPSSRLPGGASATRRMQRITVTGCDRSVVKAPLCSTGAAAGPTASLWVEDGLHAPSSCPALAVWCWSRRVSAQPRVLRPAAGRPPPETRQTTILGGMITRRQRLSHVNPGVASREACADEGAGRRERWPRACSGLETWPRVPWSTRVLTVVGRGADFPTAIERAYAAAARITFTSKQVRSDIGRKALKWPVNFESGGCRTG